MLNFYEDILKSDEPSQGNFALGLRGYCSEDFRANSQRQRSPNQLDMSNTGSIHSLFNLRAISDISLTIEQSTRTKKSNLEQLGNSERKNDGSSTLEDESQTESRL